MSLSENSVLENKSTLKLLDKLQQVKRINVNWKGVFLGLLYVITIFVSAVQEYVSSGFDIAYIGTASWWWGIIESTVTNLLILIMTFLYLLDKAYVKDKRILEKTAQIEKTIDNNLDPHTFDYFMMLFNRKRKKRKYMQILQNELNNLDKKAKASDRMVWLSKDETAKAANDYCITRSNLLNKLSEDYIEKHIDEIYIKYNITQSTFVKNGYKKTNQNAYDDPYEVESGTWKFVRDIGPKIGLSTAYIIATQSIAFELRAEIDWKLMVVAVFLKLLPMAMQIYIAHRYKKQYIEEKTLVDLKIREDILILYCNFHTKFQANKDTNVTIDLENTVLPLSVNPTHSTT